MNVIQIDLLKIKILQFFSDLKNQYVVYENGQLQTIKSKTGELVSTDKLALAFNRVTSCHFTKISNEHPMLIF